MPSPPTAAQKRSMVCQTSATPSPVAAAQVATSGVPPGVGGAAELGAGLLVFVIRQAAADAGAALHCDPVAAPHERGDSAGRERHAVFLDLDFLGQSDMHTETSRRRRLFLTEKTWAKSC